MGKLIYSGIVSLDGYVADAQGNFEWSVPDDEVHAFVNDLERPIGTYLYGRRMYDVMRFWESAHLDRTLPAVALDFAQIWQAADKVVYSHSLLAPTTTKTKLERDFDVEAVRKLKAKSRSNISIGGPHLASQAVKAGLVDEWHLFVNPIAVGGGNPYLPTRIHVELDLVDQHRFAGGVVHLHYRTKS